ncbi:AAA family ATPase [Microbispora corallina]
MEVLVGRNGELAVIDQLVDDARAGVGRALVLEGPPGIGKSALLDHAAERARPRCACFVWQVSRVRPNCPMPLFTGCFNLPLTRSTTCPSSRHPR